MENDLPDNFDLIVIGTGMKESVIAAAASRIGKRVLHLDRNDYYGGVWASFNIEGIEKHILSQEKPVKDTVQSATSFLSEGEQHLSLGNNLNAISDVKQFWHIPKFSKKSDEQPIVDTVELKSEGKEKEEKQEDTKTEEQNKCEENVEELKNKQEFSEQETGKILWTQEKIYESSRKFNLDLTPKLQYAHGDFVELLISSNIARYSEFRSCTRVLTWINDHLEIVPCSRSDVFSNTNVTVVEKRMLMKILSTCMDSDEEFFSDYKNKTFLNFLKDKKLTPNLIHYILFAISMSNENTLCLDAVKNTKRFLNSLGRFGKTPFISSMYGSGELPQAFCRLSAVFGGIYCLNRDLESLILNTSDKCTSVICGKQKITADSFVLNVELIPEKYMSDVSTEKISRAIFITNKSILDSDKENLTLLLYPSENGKNCITLIELGPSTGTCPQNLYVVYIYCKQLRNPEDDLKHCVEKLFKLSEVQPDQIEEENDLPEVLWSLYFTCTNVLFDETKLPPNVYSCSGPDLDLDYDNTVNEAKHLFKRIFPEEEFLPRAPDPEEIILCGDEENENKEGDTNSELLLDDTAPKDKTASKAETTSREETVPQEKTTSREDTASSRETTYLEKPAHKEESSTEEKTTCKDQTVFSRDSTSSKESTFRKEPASEEEITSKVA